MEVFVCSSSPVPWVVPFKKDTISEGDDEEDGDLVKGLVHNVP
jgi:hypothetical protein